MTGLVVLVVVLVLATAVGLYLRRNDGRFKDVPPSRPVDVPQSVGSDAPAADVHVATRSEHGGEVMREEVVGAPFGSAATFVQFSGPFCAQCGPTRRLLQEISEQYDGVVHIDIDCEERMDLVRQYGVMRTPTVLILDPTGMIVKRGVGTPRKIDVVATLGDLVDPGN